MKFNCGKGSYRTHPIMLVADGRSPSAKYAAGTFTRTDIAPRGEISEGFAREYATKFPSSPNIIRIVPIHHKGTSR